MKPPYVVAGVGGLTIWHRRAYHTPQQLNPELPIEGGYEMPLTYNLSHISNWRDVTSTGEGDEARISYVTEALIFGTMICGLNEITTNNIPEWDYRLAHLQVAGRYLLRESVGRSRFVDRQPTHDELVAHIGLRTNASTMTRREFHAVCARIIKESAERLAQERQEGV